MLNLPFKIVIPSHNRPTEILKNPLYPYSTIVVNDASQVDKYRAAADKANVTPGTFVECGNLPSIATVRNFILREVWNPATEPFHVQLDDDLLGMIPVMQWKTAMVSDPQDIVAIFWESYISCNDSGAKIFGYAQKPGPQFRYSRNPIALRGWLRAISGILDPSLVYDDQMYVMEDVDICLQSQAKDRIIWQDLRWAPMLLPNWTTGGIAHTRTEERRQLAFTRINARWGENTVKPVGTGYQFRLYIDGPAAKSPPRNGDKKQARNRVATLIKSGLLPKASAVPCADCGHTGEDIIHEYDHYLGYSPAHHETVEAVCMTCHAARKAARLTGKTT